MSSTMFNKLSPIFARYAQQINQNTSDVTDIKTNVLAAISASDINATWESGTISVSTGQAGNNAKYIRTTSIDASLLALASIQVKNDSEHNYAVHVFRFFDDSTFSYEASDVLSAGDTFYVLTHNASTIRVVMRRSPASEDISTDTDPNNITIKTYLGSQKIIDTFEDELYPYEPYTSEFIRFNVSVNTAFPVDGTGTSTLDSETFENIPCILKLPETYDPKGEPVPLIMFSHGTGTSVTSDSSTSQINNYFTYVGDSKCAVFDCNGMVVGSGSVEGMNMGGPIAVQAFHKAYLYITEHYNVQKKLIVGGNSMGGLAGFNFINSYPDIVLCGVFAYPVTALKEQAWDDPWREEVKPTIATVYNFSDTTGNTWESAKVVGYDPFENRAITVDGNKSIFFPVPIKIWHGNSDTVVAYQGSVDFINAVRSGGVPAYLRTVDGGTHGSSSVTNAFYRESKLFIRRYL